VGRGSTPVIGPQAPEAPSAFSAFTGSIAAARRAGR
jgi:hypothetical protein